VVVLGGGSQELCGSVAGGPDGGFVVPPARGTMLPVPAGAEPGDRASGSLPAAAMPEG